MITDIYIEWMLANAKLRSDSAKNLGYCDDLGCSK